MTTNRWMRWLAALAAAVLILAACGNDDEDDAAAGSETPAAETTDHDDEHGHDDDEHGHDTGGEDGAVEVSEPALRLMVADSATGAVQVIDLTTGEEIASLDLDGPTRLYTEPHGRHVLAAQRDDDRIDWIDAGAWTVDHGDHAHYWAGDPAVTDWGQEAAEPTHVVFHGDLLALFNDGDGSVLVIDTHHLGDDDALIGDWDIGDAHHGVAVADEDLGVLVVTEFDADAADDSTLPDTVVVLDLESGDEIDRFDGECPGLHGEFATASVVAFGCTDGVLLIEPHGDHWHSHKVAPPADAPADTRTGTLQGGHDLDYLIGNLGSDALVRIDIEAESATTIPLPETGAAWTFDAATEQILILTVDGRLHTVDASSGEVVDSIELSDPIELPSGHGGPPRPSIALGADRAYVSLPDDEAVVEVAFAGELREARRFAVGIAPLSLAVAGHGSH